MSTVVTQSRKARLILAAAVQQPVLQSLEPRRLLSASTLDTTYGTGGAFVADLSGNNQISLGTAAAIQSDDKVIVGGVDGATGISEINIARLTTSGALDPSFNGTGVFQLSINPNGDGDALTSIKVDSQGRIVATGETADSGFFIVRLLSNGTLDTSFGAGAGFIVDNDLAPQNPQLAVRSDGAILVTGTASDGNGFLAQFTPDGTLDTSFNTTGVRTFIINNDFIPTSLTLESSGVAIVGGNADNPDNGSEGLGLVAINSNGSLDTAFGNQGFVLSQPQQGLVTAGIAVDSSDRIYASYTFVDLAAEDGVGVQRFSATGQVDTSYGISGQATLVDPTENLVTFGLTVDSANRAVFTGGVFPTANPAEVDLLLGRFTAGGTPDTNFSTTGYTTASFDPNGQQGEGVVVQSDGRIVAVGQTSDETFAARFGDAPVTPPPTPVTIDANGNLIIPGTAGNDIFQVNAATGGVDVIYNGVDAGVFSPTGIIIVTGKAGNDTITIDSAVTIAASINGGAGNDTIIGGSGNDSINGAAGDDSISGGAGNDVIIAGDGNDNLSGGAGNDSITAGVGIDIINVGDGNNTVSGGQGGDVITAGNGNNVITGGAGDETIVVGNGNNSINGGAGNDSITAGNGNNTINGGAGDDVIVSGTGSSSIIGGDGNDSITVAGGANTISAGAGDDTVIGGSGADSIDGGAGNDIIVAGAGNDIVNGGAGNDILIADAGADNLTGGGDDDILVAGATSFDSNLTALSAIKAEWTSSDTYAQRVASIENGSGTGQHLNGTFFLSSGTVFNDGSPDTVTGGGGTDLFFTSTGDSITDLAKKGAETDTVV